VWKLLKYGKEYKKTHMCGEQPSLIPYLSFERKKGYHHILKVA
jgi:hypothetical protein